MKTEKSLLARLLVPLAAMALGSACILEMAGGPTATPKVIVVTATGGIESQGSVVPSPTMEPTLTLTWTLTRTFTPEPTFTATTAPVTMTAGQDLSCVKGPHWILYEWVASIAKGETVTLLAKAAPEWEEYYFVRKSNGTECWAFGGSSPKSGSLASLPVKEAPPLPVVQYAIDNKTLLPVCDVFIRSQYSTDWGADRLGSGTIAAGMIAGPNVTAGFYDVRINDCHGGTLFEKENTAIGSEPTSRYTLLENRIRFYIRNDSVFDICRISAIPHDSSGFIDLYTPADGTLHTGDQIWATLLAGMYEINLHECGDLTVVVIFTNSYIGPLTTGFPH
jgi:hypothetical protein